MKAMLLFMCLTGYINFMGEPPPGYSDEAVVEGSPVVLHVYSSMNCEPCRRLEAELAEQDEYTVIHHEGYVSLTDGTQFRLVPVVEVVRGNKVLNRYVGYRPWTFFKKVLDESK